MLLAILLLSASLLALLLLHRSLYLNQQRLVRERERLERAHAEQVAQLLDRIMFLGGHREYAPQPAVVAPVLSEEEKEALRHSLEGWEEV